MKTASLFWLFLILHLVFLPAHSQQLNTERPNSAFPSTNDSFCKTDTDSRKRKSQLTTLVQAMLKEDDTTTAITSPDDKQSFVFSKETPNFLYVTDGLETNQIALAVNEEGYSLDQVFVGDKDYALKIRTIEDEITARKKANYRNELEKQINQTERFYVKGNSIELQSTKTISKVEDHKEYIIETKAEGHSLKDLINGSASIPGMSADDWRSIQIKCSDLIRDQCNDYYQNSLSASVVSQKSIPISFIEKKMFSKHMDGQNLIDKFAEKTNIEPDKKMRLNDFYKNFDALLKSLYEIEKNSIDNTSALYIDEINPANYLVSQTQRNRIKITKIDNTDFDVRPISRTEAVQFSNMLCNHLASENIEDMELGEFIREYNKIIQVFESSYQANAYLDCYSVNFLASSFKNFLSIVEMRTMTENKKRRKGLELEAKIHSMVLEHYLEMYYDKYRSDKKIKKLLDALIDDLKYFKSRNIYPCFRQNIGGNGIISIG